MNTLPSESYAVSLRRKPAVSRIGSRTRTVPHSRTLVSPRFLGNGLRKPRTSPAAFEPGARVEAAPASRRNAGLFLS